MPFQEAKCTNCGAELMLDDEMKLGFCNHCGSQIVIRDAIQRVKIDEPINVEGIQSKDNKLENVKALLDMCLFEDANQILSQLIKEAPRDYRVWVGLYRVYSRNGQTVANYSICLNHINRAIMLSKGQVKEELQKELERYKDCQQKELERFKECLEKSNLKEQICREKDSYIGRHNTLISDIEKAINRYKEDIVSCKSQIHSLRKDRTRFIAYSFFSAIIITLFFVFLLVGSNEGLWFTIRSWGLFISFGIGITLIILGFRWDIFQNGLSALFDIPKLKRLIIKYNIEMQEKSHELVSYKSRLTEKLREFDTKTANLNLTSKQS